MIYEDSLFFTGKKSSCFLSGTHENGWFSLRYHWRKEVKDSLFVPIRISVWLWYLSILTASSTSHFSSWKNVAKIWRFITSPGKKIFIFIILLIKKTFHQFYHLGVHACSYDYKRKKTLWLRFWDFSRAPSLSQIIWSWYDRIHFSRMKHMIHSWVFD